MRHTPSRKLLRRKKHCNTKISKEFFTVRYTTTGPNWTGSAHTLCNNYHPLCNNRKKCAVIIPCARFFPPAALRIFHYENGTLTIDQAINKDKISVQYYLAPACFPMSRWNDSLNRNLRNNTNKKVNTQMQIITYQYLVPACSSLSRWRQFTFLYISSAKS